MAQATISLKNKTKANWNNLTQRLLKGGASFAFDDLVSDEVDDFFAVGDLNNDGIKDLAIVAWNKGIYANNP